EEQLLEIHVAQLQAQIAVNQALDDRLEARLLFGRQLDEAEPHHVVNQAGDVALDDVEEGVDQLRLQLDRQAPHHAEVEERQPPVGHDAQVARVRVGMEEAVFEQLLQVSPGQQLDDLVRVAARGAER